MIVGKYRIVIFSQQTHLIMAVLVANWVLNNLQGSSISYREWFTLKEVIRLTCPGCRTVHLRGHIWTPFCVSEELKDLSQPMRSWRWAHGYSGYLLPQFWFKPFLSSTSTLFTFPFFNVNIVYYGEGKLTRHSINVQQLHKRRVDHCFVRTQVN